MEPRGAVGRVKVAELAAATCTEDCLVGFMHVLVSAWIVLLMEDMHFCLLLITEVLV